MPIRQFCNQRLNYIFLISRYFSRTHFTTCSYRHINMESHTQVPVCMHRINSERHFKQALLYRAVFIAGHSTDISRFITYGDKLCRLYMNDSWRFFSNRDREHKLPLHLAEGHKTGSCVECGENSILWHILYTTDTLCDMPVWVLVLLRNLQFML